MKLVPGLFCGLWFVRWGKAGAGEMELGLEIALVEGKEPLLPWGQSGLRAERVD